MCIFKVTLKLRILLKSIVKRNKWVKIKEKCIIIYVNRKFSIISIIFWSIHF